MKLRFSIPKPSWTSFSLIRPFLSIYALSKACLFLSLFSVMSCQKGANDMAEISSLQANSHKAIMLSLNEEDISMLREHNPEILRKIHRRAPLSLGDVISMQEMGFSAESMILIIEHTSSLFTLSTSDVIHLQAEGVPFKVINYMIRT